MYSYADGPGAVDSIESMSEPREKVRVRLLGSVEASEGGAPVPVRGSRRQAVLALLALHRGTVISVDRLVDVVWDGHGPATAANTLQSHVSHLRHLLGDPGAIVLSLIHI